MSKENAWKYKNYKFGSYTGQFMALRRVSVEKFGAEKVALLTDKQLERLFIDDGYIPIVVSSQEDSEEMIYLIKQDILDNAIRLSR